MSTARRTALPLCIDVRRERVVRNFPEEVEFNGRGTSADWDWQWHPGPRHTEMIGWGPSAPSQLPSYFLRWPFTSPHQIGESVRDIWFEDVPDVAQGYLHQFITSWRLKGGGHSGRKDRCRPLTSPLERPSMLPDKWFLIHRFIEMWNYFPQRTAKESGTVIDLS